MSFFTRSLARRMAVFILLGAGLVLAVILIYSHVAQSNRILSATRREGDILARAVTYQIEVEVARAEAVVQQSAVSLKEQPFSRAFCQRYIYDTLHGHPELYGMAIALSRPTAARSDFRILYGWRHSDQIRVADRPSVEDDYKADWFILPSERRQPVWTEPYFDAQGGTDMVTYSVPIMKQGEVVAVVTCDLSLTGIQKMVDALPVGKGGMAVLLSQAGVFIAHPEENMRMKETIYTLADSLERPDDRRTVRLLGDRMLSGVPGHMRYRRPFGHFMACTHYRKVPSTGWVFGIIRAESTALAPLVRLNWITALMGVLGLLLLLIPAVAIAWSVSRPLRELARSARLLAEGQFDAPLPDVRRADEVGHLSAAFDRMRTDLKRYISDLTSTTAAKERIAGELSAARGIQMSIVPKLFPPLPDRPDVDLYALLIPALEVGGDLYDFALLDDDHLYVAIGDVSGKGVPASLMMAVGKTLLKSTVQVVRDPARALQHVNEELAEGNDTCMFITMFCGILNLKTGDFIYANAGHNPPLIARRDGNVELLKERPGPALAICPGAKYASRVRKMTLGDLLLLYTDGVTEAMSPDDQLYGEERLLAFVQREGYLCAKPLLEALGNDVRAHAAGAPQSDDITALAVRFREAPSESEETPDYTHAEPPREPDSTLVLRNTLDDLPRLAEWCESLGVSGLAPDPLRSSLNLALEEWVVNVISYAYTDQAEHAITIRLWRDQHELLCVIDDDGRPFDPTAQAEADTTLALEHRRIGGLGIHFIRNTMDRFTYRREDGRNIVSMAKRLCNT